MQSENRSDAVGRRGHHPKWVLHYYVYGSSTAIRHAHHICREVAEKKKCGAALPACVWGICVAEEKRYGSTSTR